MTASEDKERGGIRSSKAEKARKTAAAVKPERSRDTGRFKVKLVRREAKPGVKPRTPVVVVEGDVAPRAYLKNLIGIKVRSRSDLAKRIKTGFPVVVFETFAHSLDIPEAELAGHTGVPPRTLARRKATGRLLPDESDRVARIAMLMEEAVDLFDGDQNKAAHWFKSPKRALGGATPIDYAETDPGAQEVRALIGRLQHGVVA